MNKAAAARNIEVLASSGRRPEAARQLLGAWRGHSVTVDELKTLLADIWLYLDPPVAPYGPLAVAEWLELFGATGFFMQGPPIQVVDHERWVLYRAAPEDRARSMSWCTSRVMAERFIPRQDRFGAYRLWTATLDRSAVLAVLYRPSDGTWDASGEVAREVVVDPAGIGELIVVGPG